jgi:nucleoside-diphosphate kinase
MCRPLERTLVLVKPDGVQRGLCGEIIGRLERKGLRLVAAKLLVPDRSLAEAHYAAHRERPFFPELVRFFTSGPVLAMVWEGPRAVDQVRALMGATDPLKAAPGSIRGDLALDVGQNLVHGSDGVEAAAREIALFFRPEEIVAYRRDVDRWAQGPEA